MWVAYALPRTARRRDLMGRARAAELTEMTSEARDLSEAVHTRRSSREVNAAMSQDRLLLRPADPTSRPRFDAVPGTRIDVLEARARSRRLMRTVLALLAVGTVALIGLALAQVIAWWVPLIAVAGLSVYLVGLRRAELERRARTTRAATRARRSRAERETARRATATTAAEPAAEPPLAHAPSDEPAQRESLDSTTERAAHQVAAPGEWMPRPVPRPTYALHGEVEDLATRHAAHRQSMQPTPVPLESEGVEELEAADEAYAPAQDLQLDEVLARRRA
nr:hypothetical protein [Brachybacterium sacelli]